MNLLADFVVQVPPAEIRRIGRKVVSLELQFWGKPPTKAAEAAAERQRHSAGRRARLRGNVETIVPEMDTEDLP